MTPEEVGRRIRMLRIAHAKSQADLGAMLGLSGTAISHYECGTVYVPTEKLMQLALIFNVSVDYLIGNTDRIH